MAGDKDARCRLCGTRTALNDAQPRLCSVCDEYAQHVALQSNQALERVVGELKQGPVFLAASRRMH